MKRRVLLSWLIVLLGIAAHRVWASGWMIAGLKQAHAEATHDDVLLLEALDQIEASSFGHNPLTLKSLAEERLALAHRQRRDVLELAEALVAHSPQDPDALILRAQIWKSKGRLRSAVDDIRAAKNLLDSDTARPAGRALDAAWLARRLAYYEACLKTPE